MDIKEQLTPRYDNYRESEWTLKIDDDTHVVFTLFKDTSQWRAMVMKHDRPDSLFYSEVHQTTASDFQTAYKDAVQYLEETAKCK